jgi:hypothetical protein
MGGVPGLLFRSEVIVGLAVLGAGLVVLAGVSGREPSAARRKRVLTVCGYAPTSVSILIFIAAGFIPD